MMYKDFRKVYEVEELMEYRKWCEEIPFITFPNDWKIKIIPPFNGAVVRFRVEKDGARVSIYLDCYDKLGCYGEPYWEVYPHGEDVCRCAMNDTEMLLELISESIKQQNVK